MTFLKVDRTELWISKYTHRLATLDSVSGTLRVLGETFDCNLMMFCSDLSKAFKEILAVDSLQNYTVILEWDPVPAMLA